MGNGWDLGNWDPGKGTLCADGLTISRDPDPISHSFPISPFSGP
jgi:hypothetical protein